MKDVMIDGRPAVAVSVSELREGDTVGGRPLQVVPAGATTYLRIPGVDGRVLCDIAVSDPATVTITVDPRDGFSPARLADRMAAEIAAGHAG